MRQLGWLCTLTAVVALIGCGGGGATPKATLEAYKAAMANREFEQVWDMLSEATKQQMAEEAKKRVAAIEAVEKSGGPDRVALENQARMMDMTLEKMKEMDGKALFVGLFAMASKGGKEEWDKISRVQFSREEITGDKAKVFVNLDGKEEADPLPLVLEDGKWKIDLRPGG